MNPENQKFVYVTLIKTTPKKLWEALIKPDFSMKYFLGTRVESDWKIGSKVVYRRGDDITDEGVVLKFDPPRLLSYTFHHVWKEELRNETPSRVTFEIGKLGDEPGLGLQGDAVRLTVTHEDFPSNSKVFLAISKGWPIILSGLKTLLETGRDLGIKKVAQ